MKHTATPWGPILVQTDDHFTETNHKYAIAGGKCGVIAKVEGKGDEHKANAKRIVHCVNVHDELVEALDRLTNEFIQLAEGEFGDAIHDHPPEAISNALKALKLAKGE